GPPAIFSIGEHVELTPLLGFCPDEFFASLPTTPQKNLQTFEAVFLNERQKPSLTDAINQGFQEHGSPRCVLGGWTKRPNVLLILLLLCAIADLCNRLSCAPDDIRHIDSYHGAAALEKAPVYYDGIHICRLRRFDEHVSRVVVRQNGQIERARVYHDD